MCDELMALIEQVDKTNRNKVGTKHLETVIEEFVMDENLIRFLEYVRRNKGDQQQICDFDQWLKGHIIPIKKLMQFDICRHMAGQNMYLHKHTYLEIDYVLFGQCDYFIGDSGNKITLKEKELCIVSPPAVHGISVPDDNSIIIKMMIPYTSLRIGDYKNFGEHILYRCIDSSNTGDSTGLCLKFYDLDSEKIQALLVAVFSEFTKRETGWDLSVQNKVSDLLLLLFRSSSWMLLYGDEDRVKKLDISLVLSYIQNHYDTITLKVLAETFHFHENYLGQQIKHATQISYKAYLKEIRMAEACRMLKETDLSVKEIALAVGYKKPQYFYKIFKAYTGMTPKTFQSA